MSTNIDSYWHILASRCQLTDLSPHQQIMLGNHLQPVIQNNQLIDTVITKSGIKKGSIESNQRGGSRERERERGRERESKRERERGR